MSTWAVEKMTQTYMRTPWIVLDPTCPPGRHPTRECGCTVFKSEKEAREYAAKQRSMSMSPRS